MSETATIQPTAKKRQLSGVVVRKSGAKTVAVEISRTISHALYGKQINRTSRYLAHDEKDAFVVGDAVIIQESRPLSRRKRWVVINKAV